MSLGVALAEILVPNTDLEYHIQTDQGPERFFRFQTQNGQYRKEQRHLDGSVTGSYGWVDPNGVLRLYDYISDHLGYRIQKERMFKVGSPVPDGRVLPTSGGDLNLGFEVFPLDLESDPAFNGAAALGGGVPLIGAGGFRSIHNPEGAPFHLTPSYQVGSLTSTHDDVSNPLSKQAQATFFEGDPILVRAIPAPIPPPPPPPPKPKIVIGSRANPLPPAPSSRKIVIGAAASGYQPEARARSDDDDNDRPIVIGRTGRMMAL